MITGDATATDPVCSLAPAHGMIEQKLFQVNAQAENGASGGQTAIPIQQENFWVYRPQPK